MTNSDWTKIRAEYIKGGISQENLAKKYGVSYITLRRHAKAENWTEKRAEKERKTIARIVDEVAQKDVERNVRQIDLIDATAEEILTQLNNLVRSGVIVSATAYKDVSVCLKNIADLKGRQSELDAEEQRARIEKLRKDCEEQKAQQIVITMDENLKDFTN